MEDVFISSKVRKGRNDAFGFVRFRKMADATTALEKVNCHRIKDSKIRVSFARYDKGGKAFRETFKPNGENSKHLNRKA